MLNLVILFPADSPKGAVDIAERVRAIMALDDDDITGNGKQALVTTFIAGWLLEDLN